MNIYVLYFISGWACLKDLSGSWVVGIGYAGAMGRDTYVSSCKVYGI